MFVRAVVVAGDRSGTHVDAFADRRITDVGQMIDLAARADAAFLDLDKIAELGAVREFGIRVARVSTGRSRSAADDRECR